jgi:hypothetical protein
MTSASLVSGTDDKVEWMCTKDGKCECSKAKYAVYPLVIIKFGLSVKIGTGLARKSVELV